MPLKKQSIKDVIENVLMSLRTRRLHLKKPPNCNPIAPRASKHLGLLNRKEIQGMSHWKWVEKWTASLDMTARIVLLAEGT
jgi:hypothetical protein